MSILTVVQSAATVIGIEVPAQVFPSTDRTMVEMKSMINRVAKQVAREHDWSMLRMIYEITDTGSDFELPPNYDRMIRDGEIWGSSWGNSPLSQINSLNEWIQVTDQDYSSWSVSGYWTIMGGRLHVSPASGSPFKFGFISNEIVRNGQALKQQFTNDADVFRLSEYLLELALIWNWKAAKGDDYAEEMAAYQVALADEISADRGPSIVRMGSSRLRNGIKRPYTNRIGYY